MNYVGLSKKVSYILRHEQHDNHLEIDDRGWCYLSNLISILRKDEKFSSVVKKDIVEMIKLSEKKRHEIDGDKIRATYGHTTGKKIIKQASPPPNILYHGTINKFLESIFSVGLHSRERHYVHLSKDIDIAINVAKRRDSFNIVILEVESEKAYNEGILFYCESDGIWLSDNIPPKYLKVFYL